VGRERFVPQIGTLSGNPIAAVAGLATLRILKRPGTYERMRLVGDRLRAGLTRLLGEARVPAQVVGEAVLFDIMFTTGEITDYRSTLRADKEKLARFVRLLRERGVLRGESKFYLSTAHDERDVEATLAASASALETLGR
jgi:glutamate-1-semialdehyde 2,1-aminomutase